MSLHLKLISYFFSTYPATDLFKVTLETHVLLIDFIDFFKIFILFYKMLFFTIFLTNINPYDDFQTFMKKFTLEMYVLLPIMLQQLNGFHYFTPNIHHF